MTQNLSDEASEPWQRLLAAERAFIRARMEFLRHGDVATGIIEAALDDSAQRGTALRLLPFVKEAVRRAVFPKLVDLAGVGHRDILLVREAILSLDHQWVREHIKPHIQAILDQRATDEEFRRYAELLSQIDTDLLTWLVSEAMSSEDEYIREVGEDFEHATRHV